MPQEVNPGRPLVEYYYPNQLSAARMDEYLARGWFRTGQGMFRFRTMYLEGKLYPVVNIRLRLAQHQPGKSIRRLLRKNRSLFRTEVGPVSLDAVKESLFQLQKSRFKGFLPPSLGDFFSDKGEANLFHTQELRVYHQDTLVAVSYFDTGKDSFASLLALYDPAYSRFSPGLYTLAEEVELARETGKKFFYPGYILPGFSQFDYKMRIGPVQYLPASGRWRALPPLNELPPQLTDELAFQTAELEAVLQQWNIPSRSRIYPFFSLGYLLYPDDYVCAPILLEIRKPVAKGLNMMAWYDPDEQVFELCLCKQDTESLDMLGYQEWEYSPGFFENARLMLLQKEKTLLLSSSPEEIAVAIGDSTHK